jgi:twitching motility protein PilT
LDGAQKQGLVIFSGAQSSGKTTTASSYTKERLVMFGGHGVTFENPVEQPLNGLCGTHGWCFQTEISGEEELAAHIEMAHRLSAPNIIFIGEIRTRHAAVEALRIALGSDQQLVVVTVHGLDVASALERLVTWAREIDGENACQNLAASLLAVVHQRIAEVNGKRLLHTPEFLLVPFTEESKAIRAKVREKRFGALGEDMLKQRNRINANLDPTVPL